MTTTLSKTEKCSLATYHLLEETSEERHEYHNGEIVTMTGGTLEHAMIIRNLMFLLHLAFQDSPFNVFGGELRIWIPEYDRGLYPDLSIFQGKPLLNGDRRDEVINPSLLIEVLSSSTEAYDRGQKFRFYRSIPTLQEYLLVSQHEPLIEHYHRTENDRWLFSAIEGLDASFFLPVNNVSISLSQVYKGVI